MKRREQLASQLVRQIFIFGVGSLLLPTLALLSGCNSNTESHTLNRSPDIFVVVVDSLRADFLPAYGYPVNIAPNLSRLIGDSVVFSTAHAAAPWTKPSVASIMTGVSVLHHGTFDLKTEVTHVGDFMREADLTRQVVDPFGNPVSFAQKLQGFMHVEVPDEFPSMASLLKSKGYAASVVEGGNPWVHSEYGVIRGFEEISYKEDEKLPFKFMKRDARQSIERFIASATSRNEVVPHLAYFHLMDMHGPYSCEDLPFFQLWQHESTHAVSISAAQNLKSPDYVRIDRLFSSLLAEGRDSKSELPILRSCYGAGLARVDQALGLLLDWLKSTGRYQNSLIVFTSDHGEEFLEHGGLGHQYTLYEELLRVPLIVKFPEWIGAGKVVDQRVSHVDILPTVLGLVEGLNLPKVTDGVDLRSFVAGKESPPVRSIVAAGLERYPFRIAVYENSTKFIFDLFENGDLSKVVAVPMSERLPLVMNSMFDLLLDPEEQTPTPIPPEKLKALRADFINPRWLMTQPSSSKTSVSVDAAHKNAEQLRALGYLK